MPKFNVFNKTDGIYVTHRPVSSIEADAIIENFPKRFVHQGYYLTARMERIDPKDVVLIKESTTQKRRTNEERFN